MTTKKIFSTLLLTAMICVSVNLSAQITIGSGEPPSEWSLLYLDASEQRKALHNARLDSLQRENLVPSGTNNETAGGVMIFNTTNNCLEYWNGKRWVSLCVGDEPQERVCPPQFGVMVGEICWARYNVDLSTSTGFAQNITDPGMIFQWNRNVGWRSTATNPPERWNPNTNSWEATSWDTTYETGTTWVNDPCPPGWRIPTEPEFRTLNPNSSSAATNGRLFRVTSDFEGIFFPFLNFRRSDGAHASGGRYWTSTIAPNNDIWSLRLTTSGSVLGNTSTHAPGLNTRMEAYAIRCVFPL